MPEHRAPKTVRNYWIETEVDGQRTTLAGGPKAKDGGFTTEVKVRNGGEIFTAATIEGVAETLDNGETALYLTVRLPDEPGDVTVMTDPEALFHMRETRR